MMATTATRLGLVAVCTGAIFALTGGAGAAADVSQLSEGGQLADAAGAPSDRLTERGRDLYLTGCSSCHGVDAQGRVLEGGVEAPTLYGVGEAAADFQLRTGRMPLSSPNAQAIRKPEAYPDEEIKALVAYVGSLTDPGGVGPAIPTVDIAGADLADGGELFRANCAACHNASGSGGALSQGRAAPTLWDASDVELVEAMRTGPGQMPVFNSDALTGEQADNVAAYVLTLSDREGPGGFDLGAVGPVPEGFVAWVALTTVLFGAMRWITKRAAPRSTAQLPADQVEAGAER